MKQPQGNVLPFNPALAPPMRLAKKVMRWSACVSPVGTSHPLTSVAQLSFTPITSSIMVVILANSVALTMHSA